MIGMNRKLTVVILTLVLIVFSLIGQTFAQNRKIGVNVGDNFVYNITALWSSNNASAVIPPYLVETNKTVAINVTVSAIQNPNVNATVTWSYTNGTDLTSLVTLDVVSGAVFSQAPNSPVFQGFYVANLFVGELLRPTGNNSFIINQVMTGNYASGLRDTNVAALTFPIANASGVAVGTETQTFYIDKATGALVQFEDHTELPDQGALVTWLLKETNVWAVSSLPSPTPSPSIPEFPQTLVLAVAAAMFLIVTVGLVAYRRQNHHNLAAPK
jgi:hypothetical protein